jgi:hypothetical protein
LIKFLIIGLGTIGYRHFESLYNYQDQLQLDCYDISNQSLERINNFLKNKKTIHKIRTINSLDKVEMKYDFIIHSTGSDIRLATLKKILEVTKIKYAILEKLLAQSIDDLLELKLISKHFEKCWVNTPMHEWDLYKKLKKNINIDSISKIEFNFFDGLACNAIHFIDFISSWKNQLPKNIDTSNLSDWYQSKREGFFDVYGELIIEYPDNTILILNTHKEKSNYHCNIYENDNKWTLVESENFFSSENGHRETGNVEYQSELTGKIVKKIIKNQDCDLPILDWSVECHVLLIKSLLKYWNTYNNTTTKFLPIT